METDAAFLIIPNLLCMNVCVNKTKLVTLHSE